MCFSERIYFHEGFSIIGIFSTREKAQLACDTDVTSGRMRGDDHEIEEFYIDDIEDEIE